MKNTARNASRTRKLQKQTKLNLALVGITGRMNRAVLQCLLAQSNFNSRYKVIGGVDSPSSRFVNKPLKKNPDFNHLPALADVMVYGSLEELVKLSAPVDVVIDFSLPPATLKQLGLLGRVYQRSGVIPAYLIGTTGFTTAEFNKIKTVAKKYPVLWSGNYSVGINMLLYLLKQVMGLPIVGNFDVEVNETHHRHKVDAPSGTAKMILDTIIAKTQKVKTTNIKTELVYDRHRSKTTRKPGQIGVSTRRGGGVIGEHEVYLYGDHETITLKHSAIDRMAFALGVVKAVEFLAQVRETCQLLKLKQDKKPALRLYGIDDVLELNKSVH